MVSAGARVQPILYCTRSSSAKGGSGIRQKTPGRALALMLAHMMPLLHLASAQRLSLGDSTQCIECLHDRPTVNQMCERGLFSL